MPRPARLGSTASKNIWLTVPLHARLAALAADMTREKGRAVSMSEAVEELFRHWDTSARHSSQFSSLTDD